MSKPFRLIDNSMTLHGLAFDMQGARMERFTANPVMLYMHNRGVVIGKWNDLKADELGYLATPEFDEEDELGKNVSRKVEKGFLKACSLGVIVHKAEMVGDVATATDWEPYEGSIVDAGSNAHALLLYSTGGDVIKDTEKHIQNLTLNIMSIEKKPDAVVTVVDLKGIALAAGLAEDATETSVVAKVSELTSQNATLSAKVTAMELAAETQKTADIKSLLDSAVAAKKINATQRAHYETLAATNFVAVKDIVDSLPIPVDLAAFAKQGAAAVATVDTVDLAAEWDKLDKTNKLELVAKNDPEKYKKLYFAKFGTELKA